MKTEEQIEEMLVSLCAEAREIRAELQRVTALISVVEDILRGDK